jgi:periplasmic divalent cation tolerance protein
LESSTWTCPALVVLCTCPDAAVADEIAHQVVTRRLAACVNRLPGVRSTYYWNDKLQQDYEVLLLIKTTPDRYEALEACLKSLHPYENPEVICTPVIAGSEAYLQWLAAACRHDA